MYVRTENSYLLASRRCAVSGTHLINCCQTSLAADTWCAAMLSQSRTMNRIRLCNVRHVSLQTCAFKSCVQAVRWYVHAFCILSVTIPEGVGVLTRTSVIRMHLESVVRLRSFKGSHIRLCLARYEASDLTADGSGTGLKAD